MSAVTAADNDEFFDAFSVAYGQHRMRRSEAGRFLNRYRTLDAWRRLPLDEQLATPAWAKPIIAWAVLTHRTTVSVDYVVACQTRWGAMARRLFSDEHTRFRDAATGLGFSPWEIDRQWAFVAKFTAASAATSPLQMTAAQFDHAHRDLLASVQRLRRCVPKTFTTPVFGLKATLFHLGVLDTRPPRRARSMSTRQTRWDAVDQAMPQLAATMRRYLDQVALSLRPGSVDQIETSLRTFAVWLLTHDPDATTVAAITRRHIEAYKTWLPTQDGYRGKTLSISAIQHRLGDLRAFFNRAIE